MESSQKKSLSVKSSLKAGFFNAHAQETKPKALVVPMEKRHLEIRNAFH
jgi:hypothetical protein